MPARQVPLGSVWTLRKEAAVKRTHCRRGHEFVPENLTTTGRCRACHNARQRSYTAAKPKLYPIEPFVQAIRDASSRHPRGLSGLAETLATWCGSCPESEMRLLCRILYHQQRIHYRTADRLATCLDFDPRGETA